MSLSEYLSNSCAQYKRSPFDLLRCIAALIPDEHPLAYSAKRDLESMSFSPPESQAMFYGRFMDDMCAAFPEEDFDSAPLWAKAISMIVLAGKYNRDEFERWLNT